MIDLSQLKQLMGDDTRVAKFLAIFASEIPRQLQVMKQAVNSGDMEEVSNTAHAIKSQVKYLNAHDVADLALRIETATEAGNRPPTLETLVSMLERELLALLDDPVFHS